MPKFSALVVPHSSKEFSRESVWRPASALSPVEAHYLEGFGNRECSAWLDVACCPGSSSCGAVGQRPDGRWAWTVFGAQGEILDEGTESTQQDAKRAVVEAMPAWHHRCAAKDTCHCHDGIRFCRHDSASRSQGQLA